MSLGFKTQFNRLTSGALALAIGLSPFAYVPEAHAIQIGLQSKLRLQTMNDQRQGVVGVLTKGSVVDIPDTFVVKGKDGKPSAELTLNNWLATAGRTGVRDPKLAGGFKSGSKSSIDYFYPIKIVKAAPGSNFPSYKGATYFVALRTLKKEKQKLVAAQDTMIEIDPNGLATPENDNSHTEAVAPCTDGKCLSRTRESSFDQLVSELGSAFGLVKKRFDKTKRRTTFDMSGLKQNFKRNCGFSLGSFIPVVRQTARENGIPSEILLAMMVQESSGQCFAQAQNSDGSKDSGLFGVGSTTARIHSCSASEIRTLKSAGSVEAVASGPQCISNPVVNLRAAAKILRSKVKHLEDDVVVDGRRLKGFNHAGLRDSKGQLTSDGWRMAVSAYNGGERWVLEAKADLEEFNRKQGTSLSPYNWENLRVFYLRRSLNDQDDRQHFGTNRGGRREKNSILNLSYAENVVPRHVRKSDDVVTVGELWRRNLAKN